ncbi:MAG: hypothetical protein ACLFSI_01520 [Halorhodospira sp.]
MSQEHTQTGENAHREDLAQEHSGASTAQAGEAEQRRGLTLREMFGSAKETDFNSYEELDAHIRRTENSTRIRMYGVPAGALLLVLAVNLAGLQQLAVAITFPLLFVAGLFMMTANINRYQLQRLKRMRDNWAAE